MRFRRKRRKSSSKGFATLKKVVAVILTLTIVGFTVTGTIHAVEKPDPKVIVDIIKNIKENVKNKANESKENLREYLNYKSKLDSLSNDTEYLEVEEGDNILVQGAKNKAQSFLNDLSQSLIELSAWFFKTICTMAIILPLELITAPGVLELYFVLLMFSCCCCVLFLLYSCLMALLNGNPISISVTMINAIKAVAIMLVMPHIFPLLILFANAVSKGIIAIGFYEVEMNKIMSYSTQSVGELAELVFSCITSILLLAFLLIVFLHTCTRYWLSAKAFLMAPLALSLSVTPETSSVYLSWLNKTKALLSIQVIYALHITIFVTLLAVPLPALLRFMILIGGIKDMSTIPYGVDSLMGGNMNGSGGKVKSFGRYKMNKLISSKLGLGKKGGGE